MVCLFFCFQNTAASYFLGLKQLKCLSEKSHFAGFAKQTLRHRLLLARLLENVLVSRTLRYRAWLLIFETFEE